MTLSELILKLAFSDFEKAAILKTDKVFKEKHGDLYKELVNSYLESAPTAIQKIRECSSALDIYEELLGLWFCLDMACERMYREYKRLNIGDEYFFAGILNVKRYIKATDKETERFGIMIDIYVRALRHLIELEAFRIGAFNFEFMEMDKDAVLGGVEIKKGDRCISLHIPINTDIGDEAVEYDFKRAKDFFKESFGMQFPAIQLYSWLLHPSLKECLPEDSKLVKFQKRFALYDVQNSPISPIEYVFGLKYAEEYKKDKSSVARFPEETTLQKKFKERLINGEPIGCAKGITIL